jgi:hypothetical protein
MALDRLYPVAQRHNLLQAVRQQIADEAEEQDVTQDRAFIHVALDVLGYQFEPISISDGSRKVGQASSSSNRRSSQTRFGWISESLQGI